MSGRSNHITIIKNNTEKVSQLGLGDLVGLLPQSLGLVPHKPSQKLPAGVLWNGLHEFYTPCEMLVRNLGIRNVLSFASWVNPEKRST